MRLTTIVASLAMALASVQANYLLENPFKDTFKMTQSDTVVNCENRLDEILRIDYINLSPDPPKRAQSFDIDAKAYLEEEIVEGAYMNVLVK
ncbi:hypothetical protein BGW38_009581 [Lunasporangiospora selenospora]|uniref:MD-2-related lipid-recognition domain-containing protein n=1 Tax=Lunasporangiospora selenospora TaxID=979761 RepID=A0A9P6FFB4_9FUNG|nr:hypothetical protein BGW38_009581 [Lunasporangiospora selenospora]